MFASDEFKNDKKKGLSVLDRGVMFKDLLDSGLLREDAYIMMMAELIVPKMENDSDFLAFMKGETVINGRLSTYSRLSESRYDIAVEVAEFIRRKNNRSTSVSPEVVAAAKEQNKTPTQKKMTESRANARER